MFRIRGALTFEKVEAKKLEFNDEGVANSCLYKRTFKDGSVQEGKIHFKYLIDATGERSLVSRIHMKNKIPLKCLANVSIGSYFVPISDFVPFHRALILGVDDGWMWIIPVNTTTKGTGLQISVGYVLPSSLYREKRKSGLSDAEILKDALDRSTAGNDLLSNTTMGEKVEKWADFSTRAKDFVMGSNVYLCGDSAGFLDPLNSNGTLMAHNAAIAAATAIHTGYTNPEIGEERAAQWYSKAYKMMYERYLLYTSSLYLDIIPGFVSWDSIASDIDPEFWEIFKELVGEERLDDTRERRFSIAALRRREYRLETSVLSVQPHFGLHLSYVRGKQPTLEELDAPLEKKLSEKEKKRAEQTWQDLRELSPDKQLNYDVIKSVCV